MKRIIEYFSYRYLPRWVVLLFDLTVLPISYFLAFLLRFNFNLTDVDNAMSIFHLAPVLLVFLFCFLLTKPYSGILRHSTTKDVTHIIIATISAGSLLILFELFSRKFNAFPKEAMPISVIIIMIFLVSGFLIFSRLIVKKIFRDFIWNKRNSKKVVIFGAGQLGQITRNILLLDASINNELIAFVDDNTSLQNKHASGTPVYSVEKAFNQIIPKHEVTELIFAVDHANITMNRKREITDMCLKHHLIVKEVPPVKNWINGELQTQAILRIKIEDLLGRDAIKMDKEKIETGLKDAVVLVTGAAGSIGSEIIRQLISFNLKRVILFDKAESDLYNLEQEILAKSNYPDFEVIVGDVTNLTKLRKIFEEFSPTIVFNAAAYKHVPLMEKFPCEAIRVNIGGTKNLADLSIEFGVEKFVFISTDKAVNPTNVMGATKRVSEIYIQSIAQTGKVSTKFITTRFGNVLGSNGSVVPLFKKQIENGGPLTVTHRDITRYFMTIPEACQLVLEAGFMGKGGEIFIFDMGEPIKIYDLAKKMISLSGFVPEKDIKIKITDLRPGEKLYEELLDHKEELMPTYNDKILIGKVRKHEFKTVNKRITKMLCEIDEMTRSQMVNELMHLVPEYVSTNLFYNNGKEIEEVTASISK